MNALKHWMSLASPDEKILLANLSSTTLRYLQQISGGYRTNGHAQTTPELARMIEIASRNFPNLPFLNRTKLCPACAKCEYSRLILPT